MTLEEYAFQRGVWAREDLSWWLIRGHVPWTSAEDAYTWFAVHELMTLRGIERCREPFLNGWKSIEE